jgi:Ca-activated chloride channel family protein
MLHQIKGYADKGITLTTVGFGVGNYRDTLMEQLADKGDGTNVYIDDPTQAERVFVDQVSGTLVTIARDVKIQVEMNPESVESYRLIGYENRDIADRDFRNDRVDAGEVGSGHNVTALYDVVLKDGYSRQLATVRLRYEKPGADGTAMEKSWKFEDTALAESPQLASRATRIAYSAGTFAEVLRHSQYADGISLPALEKFARESSRSKNADDQELAELIHRASTLGRAMAATE